MKRCPITYEIIADNATYSQRGLHLLSPALKNLSPLAYSAAEQRSKSIALMGKMSIQGIQKKVSAQLRVKEGRFDLVDQFGHYILKPPSEDLPELPANEAITMSLAATIAIETPVHGLLYSKDNSMTYFIKRFDRAGHNRKLPTEDFAQLSGGDRNTKYNSTMEKVAQIITTYCTFPKIELAKLFKLTLFNYLIGNEDMHLKNFSLITRDKITTLSPAYDLLNSTIALPKPEEELALSINGRKRNLNKRDLFEYYAAERLKLNEKTIADISGSIQQALPQWHEMIKNSYLSKPMQKKYISLLQERCNRLEL